MEKLRVAYQDEYDIWGHFNRELSDRLPLRDVQWPTKAKKGGGRFVVDSLPIEWIKWKDYMDTNTSEKKKIPTFEDSNISVRKETYTRANSPFLFLYIVHCEDLDTYKQLIKGRIRKWLALVKEVKPDGEWLVLYIAKNPVKIDFAQKLFGKIYDRIRSDFNPKNKDCICQLKLSFDSDTKAEEYWTEFIKLLKSSLISTFEIRAVRLSDAVRNGMSGRFKADWNFADFAVTKESLAMLYQRMRLLEEAQLEYDELEAVLAERGTAGTRKWDVFDERDLARAESTILALGTGEAQSEMHERISEDRASYFGFANYLFARQARLLFERGCPAEVAGRSISFLRGTAQLKSQHEERITEKGTANPGRSNVFDMEPYFVDEWVYITALDIVKACGSASSAGDHFWDDIKRLRSLQAELLGTARYHLRCMAVSQGIVPPSMLPDLLEGNVPPLKEWNDSDIIVGVEDSSPIRPLSFSPTPVTLSGDYATKTLAPIVVEDVTRPENERETVDLAEQPDKEVVESHPLNSDDASPVPDRERSDNQNLEKTEESSPSRASPPEINKDSDTVQAVNHSRYVARLRAALEGQKTVESLYLEHTTRASVLLQQAGHRRESSRLNVETAILHMLRGRYILSCTGLSSFVSQCEKDGWNELVLDSLSRLAMCRRALHDNTGYLMSCLQIGTSNSSGHCFSDIVPFYSKKFLSYCAEQENKIVLDCSAVDFFDFHSTVQAAGQIHKPLQILLNFGCNLQCDFDCDVSLTFRRMSDISLGKKERPRDMAASFLISDALSSFGLSSHGSLDVHSVPSKTIGCQQGVHFIRNQETVVEFDTVFEEPGEYVPIAIELTIAKVVLRKPLEAESGFSVLIRPDSTTISIDTKIPHTLVPDPEVAQRVIFKLSSPPENNDTCQGVLKITSLDPQLLLLGATVLHHCSSNEDSKAVTLAKTQPGCRELDLSLPPLEPQGEAIVGCYIRMTKTESMFNGIKATFKHENLTSINSSSFTKYLEFASPFSCTFNVLRASDKIYIQFKFICTLPISLDILNGKLLLKKAIIDDRPDDRTWSSFDIHGISLTGLELGQQIAGVVTLDSHEWDSTEVYADVDLTFSMKQSETEEELLLWTEKMPDSWTNFWETSQAYHFHETINFNLSDPCLIASLKPTVVTAPACSTIDMVLNLTRLKHTKDPQNIHEYYYRLEYSNEWMVVGPVSGIIKLDQGQASDVRLRATPLVSGSLHLPVVIVTDHESKKKTEICRSCASTVFKCLPLESATCTLEPVGGSET